LFAVGGPPAWLAVLSTVLLVPGVVLWLWSVVLILCATFRVASSSPTGRTPRAPSALHLGRPPRAAVGGLPARPWLGAVMGLVLYAATRRYAPAEEAVLARVFGPRWETYRGSVRFPRL